jgi:hypothetical protein
MEDNFALSRISVKFFKEVGLDRTSSAGEDRTQQDPDIRE